MTDQDMTAIAARHGFSTEAVAAMAQALRASGGRMAQFNHPEFGGAGQWLQGGMTMIGTMFDDALKARVAALCQDLAGTESAHTGTPRPEPAPDPSQWWPNNLGVPAASGAQNDIRYAYFPQARRLIVQRHGTSTLYDTGDHVISGVGQQQARDGSLLFTSQSGIVDLASLAVVPEPTGAAQRKEELAAADWAATLEQLAELHAQGILSDAEFEGKKSELLRRL